ncbi:MAG: DUF4199 domain-containing protein [Bacteroidales bacterium]|nr:DUF4199 domain-containing protein [Bacteroidales bacterium]
MEENKRSVVMPSLMYGIYLGIVLIVFNLIMYLLDVDRASGLMRVSYLIMATGLFLAMISVRDKYLDGFASYGKAFGTGFWTGLFAAVLGALFTYIDVLYIDPGMIDEILVKAEESMLAANPNMSDEQLDQALSMTEMFTSPLMITVWAFIENVVSATILSLIIAIFAKRENQSAT